jgi:O-succinylbenzoic acid--CoA ligase
MTNFEIPKFNPVFEISKNCSSATYIKFNGKCYSFSDFFYLVNKYKLFIKNLELNNNDILTLIGPNSIEYLAIILASFECNQTLALISEKDTGSEILFKLNQIKSKNIITTLPLLFDDINVFQINNIVISPDDLYSPSSWNTEKEALLLFTTGSTGKPKAVIHSIKSLFSAAFASNEVTKFSKNKEWLVSLPFSHIAALQIFMRSLLTGGNLRVLEKHNAESIISALKESSSEYLSVVPIQLEEIIEACGKDFVNKNLETILLAGAPSSPKLKELILDIKTEILTCYGMSEVGSHISCLPRNSNPLKRRSVGKLISNVELELRDPNTGLKIYSGNSGQIALKTPQLAIGYIHPDGTKEYFKEWFITNDIGEFDSDGFLYIKGRVDNIFISGGENISIREIELCAFSCKGVKECAVIPVGDEKWGQRPILFVVFEDQSVRNQLEEILKRDLARFKFPKEIIELSELPKIGIGKVDYQKLTKLAK